MHGAADIGQQRPERDDLDGGRLGQRLCASEQQQGPRQTDEPRALPVEMREKAVARLRILLRATLEDLDRARDRRDGGP